MARTQLLARGGHQKSGEPPRGAEGTNNGPEPGAEKHSGTRSLRPESRAMLTDSQTRLGDQLTSLESRWTELISSILQIELANVALEAEVARLSKRETELAGAL